MLLGEGGEAYLDREILKVRDEIGEEEFHEYAMEFFKNSNINYREFFKIEEPQTKVSSNIQAQTKIEKEEI